jgi:hypothetical protein
MGQVTDGMNVDEVKTLGATLQRLSQDIQGLVGRVDRDVQGTLWAGQDATVFKQQWWPTHRSHLTTAAADLYGFGQSALNNATEQLQTSANLGARIVATGTASASSGSSTTGGGSARRIGDALRSVDDGATPFALLASSVAGLTGSALLEGASQGFEGFSAVTDGWTIGEDLATHQYVNAGIDSALTSGDLTASALKDGGPEGYLAGVTLQTWVEAGKAARKIDWSSRGLQEIQQASLHDWASAFGDAAEQMPLELAKIFSF